MSGMLPVGTEVRNAAGLPDLDGRVIGHGFVNDDLLSLGQRDEMRAVYLVQHKAVSVDGWTLTVSVWDPSAVEVKP